MPLRRWCDSLSFTMENQLIKMIARQRHGRRAVNRTGQFKLDNIFTRTGWRVGHNTWP